MRRRNHVVSTGHPFFGLCLSESKRTLLISAQTAESLQDPRPAEKYLQETTSAIRKADKPLMKLLGTL